MDSAEALDALDAERDAELAPEQPAPEQPDPEQPDRPALRPIIALPGDAE